MNNKGWLFVSVVLFGSGLLLGLTTPANAPKLITQDIAAIKEMAERLVSLPQPSVAAVIFIKNVSAVLFSFILSPILCLVPIVMLVVNGWLLGLVSVMVLQEKSLGFLLAGVLPHGILEIPAIIIGEAAAFNFGVTVMLGVFKKDREKLLMSSLKQNLRYLVISLVLLFLAAIVEAYITPLFLH